MRLILATLLTSRIPQRGYQQVNHFHQSPILLKYFVSFYHKAYHVTK